MVCMLVEIRFRKFLSLCFARFAYAATYIGILVHRATHVSVHYIISSLLTKTPRGERDVSRDFTRGRSLIDEREHLCLE